MRRIPVITDRTELDEQIEKVFGGVEETILRTKNGADLVTVLNQAAPWLICSLIHKFGRHIEGKEGAYLFTRTGLTASVLPGWDNLSSRCTP